MRNKWNDDEANKLGNNLLKLRVYSSQLLGSEEDLVLHGGGNTSVKTKETNIFGDEEDIIYVKGSGWDLATIEEAGFAPVKLNTLRKMAELDKLTDIEMVNQQRIAMTNPSAPNPSVEAILHAIIPYTFVDHTHADAIVTISNTSNGEERINEIFGDNMLIIPYIMPGFLLAKEIFKLTQNIIWDKINGIILLNHGVFTFHNEAKKSYEKMIEIVTKAEDYIEEHTIIKFEEFENSKVNAIEIAELRKNVSRIWGKPVLANLNNSNLSTDFSKFSDENLLMFEGTLTPDHVIRTKKAPMILSSKDNNKALEAYAKEYKSYFEKFNNVEDLVSLDAAPRWAIWPGVGILSFGISLKNINIVHDISRHTIKAIFQAQQLGGWRPVGLRDLFEMEYWVLEQAKLKKDKTSKPMQGKIALVTGAANGIGRACVEKLVKEGAVVSAIDINPAITTCFNQNEILGIRCDVTNLEQLRGAIENTITCFGGLDMLVANAGVFPKSYSIEEMDDETWEKSLDINITSHQKLLKLCLPYLFQGIDPAIVIIGSKNVSAPGPGASAYSVAKAGLTQLGRVASLELGSKGIRVNILHPNAVFDTAIWTDEILEARANQYGLSVQEYKTNNILMVEITSKDVAKLAVQMLGDTFSKVTGAQIPIDGGNERTI
jgi:rhamnose utilization protein RhaD (predicted bifunctional aldolase and dehydrogenase)/NAD(P)-dependent dehydrogenase (short-subunit alcohol dehydrogenase family)